MGKTKKETVNEELDESVKVKEENNERTYEEKLEFVSVIAKPMAPKKLTKKCYKLIKKASKQKTFLRNGLRDVQTRIRKGETGIVIFAGDVTPIDIMCHMPGVCEEKSIPYCYTPSRQDLGGAMGVKRGSLMVLVKEHEEYKDLFEECKAEMKHLSVPL